MRFIRALLITGELISSQNSKKLSRTGAKLAKKDQITAFKPRLKISFAPFAVFLETPFDLDLFVQACRDQDAGNSRLWISSIFPVHGSHMPDGTHLR
jgi:hypothetical protein